MKMLFFTVKGGTEVWPRKDICDFAVTNNFECGGVDNHFDKIVYLIKSIYLPASGNFFCFSQKFSSYNRCF